MRKSPRRGIVGARHASPAWQRLLSGKIDEKARRDREKPSPGGWCSAQRIQNLYDCRWQSYLYYGGPAQAGPDEVEGHRFVTAHGDSRSLRPHQSQLTLRQLPLQGKPLLCPISCSVDFNYSGIVDWRAGHAAAPTRNNQLRPAPHPAGIVIPATFPQGKAPSEGSIHFCVIQPYTPSDCPYGQPPPPTRREAAPRRSCVRNSCASGHAAAPTVPRREHQKIK